MRSDLIKGIWRGKSSPSKPTKYNSQHFQIKNTNSRQYKLYDSDLESIRFFSTCKLVFGIFPVESLARMYNDCVRSNETIAQTKCKMVASTVVEGFFMVLNEGRGTQRIFFSSDLYRKFAGRLRVRLKLYLNITT